MRVLMCAHCDYDMRMADENENYVPPDGHEYNEGTCTVEVEDNHEQA